MSLEILTHESLQQEADCYSRTLNDFIAKYNLTFFRTMQKGIDHLAIKAWDSCQYEEWTKQAEKISKWIGQTPLDGRRLALARLKKAILFEGLGGTMFVEIMEPKPNRAGLGGFEHIELFCSMLDGIPPTLLAHGVNPMKEGNPYHKTVVIAINDQYELKCTNRRVRAIMDSQLKSGEAKRIYP